MASPMEPITAIHSLEALAREQAPGSERARALHVAIEALWAEIRKEHRAYKRQQKLAERSGSSDVVSR